MSTIDVSYLNLSKPRERCLADALVSGVPDGRLSAVYGVKSLGRLAVLQRGGRTVLYFDKGYERREHVRVAVNARQPTGYLMGLPLTSRGWVPTAVSLRRVPSRLVLLDGSSAKALRHLGHPYETVMQETVDAIHKLNPGLAVIYRPKPSYRTAWTPSGAYRDDGASLAQVLSLVRVVVTHEGGICVDAVRAGVPCVVLGQAPARPVSSVALDCVACPFLASPRTVQLWLRNLAACQWTLDEIARGVMYRFLRASGLVPR